MFQYFEVNKFHWFYISHYCRELVSYTQLYTRCMHPCQMCDTFCTQIRAFVLTKWRQMHEPPKNNLGCNAWFLKALQPNCRIMLRYVLFFDGSLRRARKARNIGYLERSCKFPYILANHSSLIHCFWWSDVEDRNPLFLSEMPLCRTSQSRLRVLLFFVMLRLQMP